MVHRDRVQPGKETFVDSKASASEFEYANAVDKVATSCKISSMDYELSAKPPRTSKGQKTQSCHVELKQVDITRFARFLSTIQLRWANLQCENVTLTKGKDRPDTWKVDLDFKYYY